MAENFGRPNPGLTAAIRRVARDSSNVMFTRHAEEAMDDDGFDHADVLLCLRRGVAHGPEYQGKPPKLRANVVHRGLHIRVAVGGIDDSGENWEGLATVSVVTVMESI